MFTLKLFRRQPANGSIQTVTLLAHRVVTHEIGEKNEAGQYVALELWAVQPDRGYETYYVGVPTKGMDAFGREDLHLDSSDGSWWGWGLLENSEGKTSQHYRPHSYG